ncbi:MAG: major capsid protein [Aristaeellaceae bacterium]
MPMTLAEMKVGMSDKVAQQVVDIFTRESEILQVLPFDNCVSPQGGSTLTYSYMQKKLPSTAAFRALNTEYTASQATLEKKSADLKIFGGKFSMDRVLKQAEGPWNNMAYQMREKILSAISLFHYTLINGDATTRGDEFDGLDKMLAGTATEFGAETSIDISTMAKLKENADALYEQLQNLIKKTRADALLMNGTMISKIQTMARILGYKTDSEEAFGRKVTSMDGIRFMDLGEHYTVSGSAVTANSCVKAGQTRTIASASVTGLTDIYAVMFDVNDGFHAASLTGNAAIHQYLPDFNAPGAVKDGEVEMVAATVLKNTAHAGVLRNIKIA